MVIIRALIERVTFQQEPTVDEPHFVTGCTGYYCPHGDKANKITMNFISSQPLVLRENSTIYLINYVPFIRNFKGKKDENGEQRWYQALTFSVTDYVWELDELQNANLLNKLFMTAEVVQKPSSAALEQVNISTVTNNTKTASVSSDLEFDEI